MSNDHLVFVYGTLKRGYNNNSRLTRGGAEYVGPAETAGKNKYQIMQFHSGGIPFLVPANEDIPGDDMIGELWLCDDDTLRSLDGLEGHPRNYTRSKITVLDRNSNTRRKAWAYLWHHSPTGMKSCGREWNNR